MTTTSSPGRADRRPSTTKQRTQLLLDADDLAASETPTGARVTPDLAAQGRTLAPIFPVDESGTGVVLYVGSPGLMHVHWYLDRDDFEQAAASFPVNGRRPAAVLRLHRERLGGGADLVDEHPLDAGARAGSGETGFGVPINHGLYRAELGLTDGGGGWLMLARSNRHYNAVGVGLDLPILARDANLDQGSDPASEFARVETESASEEVPPDGARTGETLAEPALSPGAPGPIDSNFPIAPLSGSQWTAAAPGTGPVAQWRDQGWAGSMTGAGATTTDLMAQFPVCVDGGALRGPRVSALLSAVPVQSLVQALAAAPGPTRLPGTTATPGSGADLDARAEGVAPGGGDGVVGAATGMSPGIGVRIEPLTYERPPERVRGLEIEAELRIHGRAEPNSTIDLFGFSYRVGPGGRFVLELRVEDPDLLRRALEAAPPPELFSGRDG